MGRVFFYINYSLIALLLCMPMVSFASKLTTLTYCYENKEFLPHFTGNNTNIPTQKPGAEIEILQALDKSLANVKFHFLREPWLRCLRSLERGKVDAVIGSYNDERAKFAVFPWHNGKIDIKRAYLRIDTCLLLQKGIGLRWDGKTLTSRKKISIAIPRGYNSINSFKNKHFDIYLTDSPEKAHSLLFHRRVLASISACNLKKYPDFIELNKDPIKKHYGYFMFSKQFYQQHTELAEQLWNNLAQIDKASYYRKYPTHY